ncbi:MAG: PEP-CTERM sorting domain-containing protein [Rubrivivax sp.]|nr:MAG: PEP-CTERM sorting domain-containing protein [Rubrivivax sp.]
MAASLPGSADVVGQSSSTGVNVRGSAQADLVVGYEAAFDTPGLPTNQFTITLAANSSISFDLSYTATVSLSPQQLADVWDAALAQADPAKTVAFTFLNADAVGSVGAGFYSGSIFDDPNMTVADGGQSLNIDATHLCEGCNMGVMTAQNSSTLSLTYANTTGNALDVSFLLFSRASVSQNADIIYFPDFPPVEPEVPAIPEPGTWALMGLGLLGLGWVRRRNSA